MGILGPGQVDMVVSKSLDAASLAQRILANNVANVNTPYFKRSEVVFEDQLQAALNTQTSSMTLTHPKHIGDIPQIRLEDVAPGVVTRYDTNLRNDRNNVDVEQEMAKLAKVNLVYRSLLTYQKARMDMINLVIEGR